MLLILHVMLGLSIQKEGQQLGIFYDRDRPPFWESEGGTLLIQ